MRFTGSVGFDRVVFITVNENTGSLSVKGVVCCLTRHRNAGTAPRPAEGGCYC